MKRNCILLLFILLFSIIYLMFKWIYESELIMSESHLESQSMSPLITMTRQLVTLNDGKYDYSLNYTSFQLEFPHLQRYQCSLIHSPPVAPYDDSDLPSVILAIKSHPGARRRRFAVRQTWATEQELKGYKLRRFFLLGRTEVQGQMEMVRLESATYGDILQWDMTEGHHNLSLKERCLLEWLHHNLPEVEYIFKGDDDVFVNVELMIDLIRDFGSPNIIHGFHQNRPPVMRHTKYRITQTLYPMEFYPGFVSGGGFIFSGLSVPRLYEASRKIPVFPLDDVYFGFLALAAKLIFRHDPRFYVSGLKYEVCRYKKAMVVHGISPDDLLTIWREVNNNDCKNSTQQKN
ncbi:beta-1,3-galactosyltransferase 5-like [Eleutherodactylus coqui]|uniref:beta-1,3-galactosyltransferase 5-like n=1 Tax=Eleutherodactylus coqui TaxID=57060 RepID=UPI003461D03C